MELLYNALWRDLTDAQAQLLMAGATLFVALVGPFLFGRSIRGVREAAEATNRYGEQIRQNMDIINESFSSLQKAVADIQNEVLDQQARTPETNDRSSSAVDSGPRNKERILTIWRAIQEKIEGVASDPKVDGRRRAKYSRVDRRDYKSLIDKMELDKTISSDDAAYFKEALNLYYNNRLSKVQTTEESVRLMEKLAAALRVML